MSWRAWRLYDVVMSPQCVSPSPASSYFPSVFLVLSLHSNRQHQHQHLQQQRQPAFHFVVQWPVELSCQMRDNPGIVNTGAVMNDRSVDLWHFTKLRWYSVTLSCICSCCAFGLLSMCALAMLVFGSVLLSVCLSARIKLENTDQKLMSLGRNMWYVTDLYNII